MGTIAESLQLAVHHHQTGDLEQAEPLYRQVLQADPLNALVHYNLGHVLLKQGRLAEATRSFRLALKSNPNLAEAHVNLGNILFAENRLADAAESYRQAVRLSPGLADAHYNLGNALFGQGHFSDAEASFRQALKMNPRHVDAHYNLGNALKEQGRLAEASACFRQTLSIDPHHADAHNNLGNALNEAGQFAQALECFRLALSINPNHADAHNNLGLALAQQGHLAEAAACYDRALRSEPGHKMALGNRSLMWLLQGNLEKGWTDYEQRLARPGTTHHPGKPPRWDGSPLAGRTILVYAEQGFGDTIQFLRYLPMVGRRGGSVLFQCQPALQSLLKGMAGVDQMIPEGEPLPPYDVHLPLLSLPGLFGTTLATIPATIPYLTADPERVAFWRQELAFLNPEPTATANVKVGIAWQGNPAFSGDRSRSIPLEYFLPLAILPGVKLVSLQKGHGTEQLSALAGRFPVLDLSEQLETFSDTAAVIMNLDLVISSCTVIPHLAGALGVPVWTALQLTPDWRWLLDRADSPWYPTMRLFRQAKPGAWGEVFERISKELGVRS